MTSGRNAMWFVALLLGPAVLYILFIVAYPLADTVGLSFTDAALKPTMNFVGWENYQKIFKPRFGEIIIRTFIWTFFSVGTKMVIGTIGAMLLAAAVPGRTLFRVLTMPPWIIPMAIGIFMWGWMYNGQFGMISGGAAEHRHHRQALPLPCLWHLGLLGDHHHRRVDRCAHGDGLSARRRTVGAARSV